MPKKALITGITGQLGSYLAEILLAEGYEVYGISREGNGFQPRSCQIIQGNIEDLNFLKQTIEQVHPNEIYNLAALSDARVSITKPEYTFRVNLLPVITICDYIKSNPETKLFQAGSAEFYGNLSGKVDEFTKFEPRNPYAVAKLAAHFYVKHYRKNYGLNLSNGIIFNSESPRRKESFVTRKITKAVSKISKGTQDKLELGNLDSRRDWIHAKDAARAIFTIVQQEIPEDYVISSGENHSIREFVDLAFKQLNLKIKWSGQASEEKGYDENGVLRVEVNPDFFRIDDRKIYGDNSKLKKIGWAPEFFFKDIVREMVFADLN